MQSKAGTWRGNMRNASPTASGSRAVDRLLKTAEVLLITPAEMVSFRGFMYHGRVST